MKTGEATADELIEMAQIAQYFDCGRALAPWVARVMPAIAKYEYTGKIYDVDMWLFISYSFGLEGQLKKIT